VRCLYKGTCSSHPKERTLITFAVIISLDRLCLSVFANLKRATPSKSGANPATWPTHTKSPSNTPHTGPLTLQKLAYMLPVPQYIAPSQNWANSLSIHGALTIPVPSGLLYFGPLSRHSRKHIQSVNTWLQPNTTYRFEIYRFGCKKRVCRIQIAT
jgi:hypothetical protein